jgi:uncharacterized membrane protein YfcA
MDLSSAALLFVAGIAGGVANAIAGGATLITFPAMLAVGLPPVIANASNAVAVTPGHLVAAISDRAKLPPWRSTIIPLIGSVIGGVAGAVLLLWTSERVFLLLVPALIASATLIFAFARPLQNAIRSVFGEPKTDEAPTRPLWLGLVSVYGGYFGAGLGIMLMAVLSITGREQLRTANALKNLFSTGVSLATLIIFWAQGVISWPHTLVMLAGAVIGGFTGGQLIRVLPPKAVRAIIITVGTGMTALYAWRYWL